MFDCPSLFGLVVVCLFAPSVCLLPRSGCCREMAAGELPYETVNTVLLWWVYFGVPASFIAVRQVLMKRTFFVVVGQG